MSKNEQVKQIRVNCLFKTSWIHFSTYPPQVYFNTCPISKLVCECPMQKNEVDCCATTDEQPIAPPYQAKFCPPSIFFIGP